MSSDIKSEIREKLSRKAKILLKAAEELSENIEVSARRIALCFSKGGKLLLVGNGGSASDAMHLAAEFVGKFSRPRNPLPAIALVDNPSLLTAIGNDFSFEDIFSRQIEALADKEDLLIAISTSGLSKNVLKAVKIAHEKGLFVIGMTGKSGGDLKKLCDLTLSVPSDCTPDIQEVHIAIGHVIVELVEEMLNGEAVDN